MVVFVLRVIMGVILRRGESEGRGKHMNTPVQNVAWLWHDLLFSYFFSLSCE